MFAHNQTAFLKDQSTVEPILSQLYASDIFKNPETTDFATPDFASAESAIAYHLQEPGSQIRARFAIHCGTSLALNTNDILCVAKCSEFLHNASLIHDDIQDHDTMRRNRPAVWSKFGTNTAICSGDLLISAAYQSLSLTTQPELLPDLLKLVHNRTSYAILGQCADLSAHLHTEDPVSHFIQLSKAKSGALFSLPVELTLLLAGHAQMMSLAREACESFAVAYQIADDIQDFEQDQRVLPGSLKLHACTNIVNIFTKFSSPSEHNHSQSVQKSAGLACDHLTDCIGKANFLPAGSGLYLISLARQLENKFQALVVGSNH